MGLARHANETIRGVYDIDCPQLADTYAVELADDLKDASCPPALRRLGRTLVRWHTLSVNWHCARVTNGTIDAITSLIRLVKWAAFGFRRFAHYSTRALLYVGKPNWTLPMASLPPEADALVNSSTRSLSTDLRPANRSYRHIAYGRWGLNRAP